MSLMHCDNCGRIVDTDDDPAALYPFTMDEMPYDCLCEQCREEMEIEDE